MITRFAPSPTGPLHLGHAYSALTVWQVARRLNGVALLRIEDTDSTRARITHETAIYDDLAWLGLHWPSPVRRQSDHATDYAKALDALAAMGLLYPCGCTRRQISAAAAKVGPDGLVYPGTCRHRQMSDRRPGDGLRLNLAKAITRYPQELSYQELGRGRAQVVRVPAKALLEQIGDPILQRKDTGDAAYHLACVHDDALQEVSHVVRGLDLRDQTPLHVLLQRLFGYPTPLYHHHDLITDSAGQRLAKIDKSKALQSYRAEGATPDDIRRMVGFSD